MFEDPSEEQTSSSSNVISEQTGPLDVRFALWRKFCGDNDLNVDTLPSELSEEVKTQWEKLKESDLPESSD